MIRSGLGLRLRLPDLPLRFASLLPVLRLKLSSWTRRRVNVNSSSQYDIDSTITSASPFNMGTSGPARNLEQAMKNATDSSVIQWTGFVDGAALF